MNIAVDYGNTIAKAAIFDGNRLAAKHHFADAVDLQTFLRDQPTTHIIVSSVSVPASEVLSWSAATGKKISLSPHISLPVRILYKTPHTLGVDRIAAVCGALTLFPAESCLVIDAGTCITFEFLDADGSYRGGGISPGVRMRFEAMHTFTAKLPLAQPVAVAPLIGDSTEASLQSGVMNGVRAEIEGVVRNYRTDHPNIRVLLCGGDASYFENLSGGFVVTAPDLVVTGLNAILRHNLTARP